MSLYPISVSNHNHKSVTRFIPCICIGVLFSGIDKPVLSNEGQPLMMADGRPRKGRGLSEGTFRKHFHGLKTLHLHFHRKQVYEVQVEYHCGSNF